MQGTVTQSSLLFCQHLNKVQGKGQRGQRLDRHRRWKAKEAKEGGASWRSHGRTAEKDTDLEMNWIIKNMCISHAYLQTSRIWIFGDFEITKLRVIGWKFNHTLYSNSNVISSWWETLCHLYRQRSWKQILNFSRKHGTNERSASPNLA